MKRALKWVGLSLGGFLLFAILWIFWLWRFFAPPPLNPLVETPIYSRSDCLIAVDVVFPDGTESDSSLREMWNIFLESIHDLRLPVAGFGGNPSTPYRLYFQFTQRCDEKVKMMTRMIANYYEAHPDGAELTLSSDRIIPSNDTKLMYGPWWTDGKDEREPKG